MFSNPRTRVTLLLGLLTLVMAALVLVNQAFHAATDQTAANQPTYPVKTAEPVPGQFLVSYAHGNQNSKDRVAASYKALGLQKDLKTKQFS